MPVCAPMYASCTGFAYKSSQPRRYRTMTQSFSVSFPLCVSVSLPPSVLHRNWQVSSCPCCTCREATLVPESVSQIPLRGGLDSRP
jgi:hypothetical protein